MPDMKTLTINGVKYNIKDNIARTALETKASFEGENIFSGQNVFTTGLYLPAPAQVIWINGAPSNRIGSINESQYTGNAATATKATQDGSGNVIVDTYAKKTELTAFAVTDKANTWTAQQTFNDSRLQTTRIGKALIFNEGYISESTGGTDITPTNSTLQLTATGAVTLDMSTIVANNLYLNTTSTVFTAYITSDADYTLTITNAGTIKYIGSASDVAITSAGLLLNILMTRDASDNVTSIVQASKLS